MIDGFETQMGAMTHNTGLFDDKLLRPDCLFVPSGQGSTVTAIVAMREPYKGSDFVGCTGLKRLGPSNRSVLHTAVGVWLRFWLCPFTGA